MNLLSKSTGCLLGGAFGDSMGAAVEFMTKEIIATCYPEGISKPEGFRHLGLGTITDDTQQALAVCRGIVQGLRHGGSDEEIIRGIGDQLKYWHAVQENDKTSRRSPGHTSMEALRGETLGTPSQPLNDSRSCGAVMRTHPLGLVHSENPERAFDLGCKCGALTHGHVDGYAPAGAFAALVAYIMSGNGIREAATKSLDLVARKTPEAKGTLKWLKKALQCDPATTATEMGQGALGWNGDEALAIGLLAALRHPDDLTLACSFASNHDGDSDTTASIAGALVGAACGEEALPTEYKDVLEHNDELRYRAQQLVRNQLTKAI